jgi:hypothetical protein
MDIDQIIANLDAEIAKADNAVQTAHANRNILVNQKNKILELKTEYETLIASVATTTP